MADTNNTERAEWKLGDEYLPFHPSASHVDPSYRDGWNACFHAGRASLAAGGEPVAWMDAERGEVVSAKWLASDEATSDYRATYTTPLYTALQPADALGDGWMPAETAPLNVPILLYGAKRLEFTVGMHHSRDGWVSDSTSEFLSMYPPTHWRPLPAPPTLNASKELQP